MVIESNTIQLCLPSKITQRKILNTKKDLKDFSNLLFEKSSAMIPLDYLEEFEEMSVNVEQIASNIIMVSECEDN